MKIQIEGADLRSVLEALDKELPHNMKHIAAGQRFNARTALAQPEQEPVAFLTNRRQRLNVEFNATGLILMPKSVDWKIPLYTTPPQRKPLTGEQRRETINRAWNDYLRGGGDDSFGWYLSQAIEAAHGVKGDA